jgi:hypothetical protein
VQVRGALKMRSPKAKRIRSINKNKAVVDTLNRYFPQDRASFGKGERTARLPRAIWGPIIHACMSAVRNTIVCT